VSEVWYPLPRRIGALVAFLGPSCGILGRGEGRALPLAGRMRHVPRMTCVPAWAAYALAAAPILTAALIVWLDRD